MILQILAKLAKPETFAQWIQLFLLLQTSLLLLLAHVSSKKEKPGEEVLVKRDRRLARYYSKTLVILSTLTLIIGAFIPPSTIERPQIYFILVGVTGFLALHGAITKTVSRSTLLYTLITLLVSIPGLVYVRNNLYPLYDVRVESLYRTGFINSYAEEAIRHGFYYIIPIDPLLRVPLSYLTAITNTWLIILVLIAFYTSIMLSLVILGERLGQGYKEIGLLGVLAIYMSTQLSFQGRILSIPFTTLALALTILYLEKPSLKTLSLFLIATVTAVFAHPAGPIAIIMLYLSLLLVFYLLASLSTRIEGYSRIHRLKIPALLFTIIAVTYWFSTTIYTLFTRKVPSLADALTRFYNTLLGGGEATRYIFGETIPKTLAPGYSDPRFHAFAYVWALPISISIAVLLLGLYLVARRKKSSFNELFLSTAALVAVIAVALSYIQYVFSKESGQYLIAVSQYLPVLPLIYFLKNFIGARHTASLLVVAIIAIGLYQGVLTPDWAPLEHPDFEAATYVKHFPLYIEAQWFSQHLQHELRVYSDYDIVITKGEYKSIRQILYELLYEKANPCKYYVKPETLIIVKTNRPLQLVNHSIVYISDYHRAWLLNCGAYS